MLIDPDKVFAQLEVDRESGELKKKVTTAAVVYYASDSIDVIVQHNRATSDRTLGNWRDDVFVPLDDDA